MTELFGEGTSKDRMGIVVRSFGFKHGLPLDSDLVLDVRFLPNPFYVEELRSQTGNDRPVADFICRYPQTFQYLKLEEQLLDFLLAHMPNPENTPAAERRTQYDAYLSQLKHWK